MWSTHLHLVYRRSAAKVDIANVSNGVLRGEGKGATPRRQAQHLPATESTKSYSNQPQRYTGSTHTGLCSTEGRKRCSILLNNAWCQQNGVWQQCRRRVALIAVGGTPENQVSPQTLQPDAPALCENKRKQTAVPAATKLRKNNLCVTNNQEQ